MTQPRPSQARPGHGLDPLLAPRSIALLGASQRPHTVGNDMVRALTGGGFAGRIYPINPKYAHIEGLRCFASLEQLPESAEHVVIGLASNRVEAALAEAIAHGARAATVFAACYLEDDTRPTLNERLAAMAREAGLALCGSSSMGLGHPASGLRLAAYPCDPNSTPGGICWVAQSGSVYGAIAYNDPRLRFSLHVSSGAELVVRANDYLDWALARSDTRVIGLFLEAVRDPEGFEAVLARAAERAVPVVVLKAGRTPASAAMAHTHTGALAGDDAAYRALFDRYGVLRVSSVDELAATLLLLAEPRRAHDGGLASVHDSGGECELLIDLAADLGVPIARIGEHTRTRLAERLEPGLEPVNPLDAWGTGRDAVAIFETCLDALMDDPATAAGFVVSDLRDGHYHHENLAAVARAVHARTGKPLAFVTNYSAVRDDRASLALTEAGIPVLDGTREALLAVKHLLAYRDFTRRPPIEPPPAPGREVTARWRERLATGAPLTEVEALALLADYGLATVEARLVQDEEALAAAARELGYPLALKTAAPGVAHKSEVDGVRLALGDERALGAAYRDLAARLGPEVTLARMAPAGVEMALGAVRDAQFGPYVMVAAGGVLIELLEDTAVGLAPLDAREAARLIDRLRARRLLEGMRGRPAVDRAALGEALARLSVLMADLGEIIDQIDVNPVIVTARGALAADALVVPRRAGPRRS